MADGLRSVLRSSAGEDLRPGQLRLRLESALGAEESARLRRLVHQVVAAAEENLPADLTRIAPLTSESIRRFSGDLAQARGWSPGTALRTTLIWTSALGFDELAASSWPRPDAAARPQPSAPPAQLVLPTALPAVPLPPRSDALEDPAPDEPRRSLVPWRARGRRTR